MVASVKALIARFLLRVNAEKSLAKNAARKNPTRHAVYAAKAAEFLPFADVRTMHPVSHRWPQAMCHPRYGAMYNSSASISS